MNLRHLVVCVLFSYVAVGQESNYFLTQAVAVDGSTSGKQESVESTKAPSQVRIEADEQRKDGDVLVASGYVVITYGMSKLQADKVIYDSVTGELSAEGNVIYDPDPFQRITAKRATVNILTKRGVFYDATGFTDQTPDGETLHFTAERAEKTGIDSYLLYRVKLTSCSQAIPIWEFEAEEVELRINKTATVKRAVFRFRDRPLIYLPALKVPIGRQRRKSGFLIPTAGSSKQRGFSLLSSYYQTLGQSADLLLRTDLYSKRGIGVGTTFRFKTDEISYVRVGHYTVFDRLFGEDGGPNESGTLLFAKGLQQLPAGFVAIVDVDYTSDLAFRRTFANDAEQIFNPENRSQFYLMNHISTKAGNYSLYLRAERKTETLFFTKSDVNLDDPNVVIKISHLPSVELVGYDRQLGRLPIYYGFDLAVEALSREDRLGRRLDFNTPTLVQRFDTALRVLWIVPDIAGWVIRPQIQGRATYYSSGQKVIAIDGMFKRQVDPAAVARAYGEFTLDIRPPSVAKTYRDEFGQTKFKHLCEPFLTYRKIEGVGEFDRNVKFDYRDAVADTNEIEYGVSNRIFVARQGEQTAAHELLTVTLQQKLFFDPSFGEALKVGARNQFFPINTLSGFTFGGRRRRFSPLNFNLRYRPLQQAVSADLRFDYDPLDNRIRNLLVSGQFQGRYFSVTSRYSRTARLQLSPMEIEPGTFPGSLLVTTMNVGNERRGYYGGTSFTYDFGDRSDIMDSFRSGSGLRRFSAYFGYACDCGSLEVSYSRVNVGGFRDNRLNISFTLSGVGSFGTERLQQ